MSDTMTQIRAKTDAVLKARLTQKAESLNIPAPATWVETHIGRLVAVTIDENSNTIATIWPYAEAETAKKLKARIQAEHDAKTRRDTAILVAEKLYAVTINDLGDPPHSPAADPTLIRDDQLGAAITAINAATLN